jgi:hypothetical protein
MSIKDQEEYKDNLKKIRALIEELNLMESI